MTLSSRDRASLDRYITGNYGEDQLKGESNMSSIYMDKDGNYYHEECTPESPEGQEHLLIPADQVVEGLVCFECGGPLIDDEQEDEGRSEGVSDVTGPA